MAVRPRFVAIGLALACAVYAAITVGDHYWRAARIGLQDQPCGADRRPITGNGLDDWAALCAWREANGRLSAAPEVVMFGDSFTEHWPPPGPGIVTRGIGGQTSGQALLRFRQDALALGPRVIHILLGTNDVVGLNGPFTAAQFEGNLLNMVELAGLHGQAVILGTLPPMRDYAGYRHGDPAGDVARINAVLRGLAERRGLVLADYHAALIRPDGKAREDLFDDDGIHLRPAGYAEMQRVFDRALAEARKQAAERDRP